MIERYKTKYAILINNAPDLSETLEKTCCGAEDSVPVAIENDMIIYSFFFGGPRSNLNPINTNNILIAIYSK